MSKNLINFQLIFGAEGWLSCLFGAGLLDFDSISAPNVDFRRRAVGDHLGQWGVSSPCFLFAKNPADLVILESFWRRA
jgi:hypothetical protein